MNVKAGIVGFRGYSGVDLVQILSRHPSATPILLEHRQDSTERPQPIGFTAVSYTHLTLPTNREV